MNCIFYNFYGFNVKIESAELSIDTINICRDFLFFQNENLSVVDLHIQIHLKEPSKAKGWYIGKTRMCRVFQNSYHKREYEYIKNDLIVAHAEKSFKRFTLSSNNVSAINEILYFFILSAVGESLDYRGIMRIHALSYFNNALATVVFGESGAGKSTLAYGLMLDEKYHIYGDEITLINVNNGSIVPFPMRIGIKTLSATSYRHSYFFDSKQMYEINKHQIAKPTTEIKFIYLESSTHQLIKIIPKIKLLNIYIKIIIGIDLPQMAEYLIRPDNIFSIFQILRNRIKLIYFLIYSTRV